MAPPVCSVPDCAQTIGEMRAKVEILLEDKTDSRQFRHDIRGDLQRLELLLTERLTEATAKMTAQAEAMEALDEKLDGLTTKVGGLEALKNQGIGVKTTLGLAVSALGSGGIGAFLMKKMGG